jgi:hypothetical protein
MSQWKQLIVGAALLLPGVSRADPIVGPKTVEIVSLDIGGEFTQSSKLNVTAHVDKITLYAVRVSGNACAVTGVVMIKDKRPYFPVFPVALSHGETAEVEVSCARLDIGKVVIETDRGRLTF